jgi:hypothetical protein
MAHLFESTATFKKCAAEKFSFVALGLFDLVLTVLAVNLGFYETNHLIRVIIQIPFLFLLVKLFIPVFLAWLIPGKLLIPSIALLAFIIAWNTAQLISYLL